MKSFLTKLIVSLLSLGLLGYIVWLFINQASIVAPEAYDQLDMMGLLFVGVISLYVFLMQFVYKIVPMNRRSLLGLGLVCMFASEMYFYDTPENYWYLKDILKIFSIILIVGGPLKWFVSKEVEEKKMEEEIEIIEV